MTETKTQRGGPRYGNPSGLRGTGKKKNVGATVKRIHLSREVALILRATCLRRYGTANAATTPRHVEWLICAESVMRAVYPEETPDDLA